MQHVRVVITGLGAITPIGSTVQEFWNGLAEGRNGVAPISTFDTTRYSVKLAAEVKGFKPEDYLPLKRIDRTSRPTHFAIAAAKQALESANLDIGKENRTRIGCIIATSGDPPILVDQGEILRTRGPRGVDPLIPGKAGAWFNRDFFNP